MRRRRTALVLGAAAAVVLALFAAGRLMGSHHEYSALRVPKAKAGQPGSGLASARQAAPGAVGVRMVARGSTLPVREAHAIRSGHHGVRRPLERERSAPSHAARLVPRDDALQPKAPTRTSPSVLSTFAGVSNSENAGLTGGFSYPPDTSGDVGPKNYVEMTNTIFSVYDKKGVKLAGPFSNQQLWASLPSGLCKENNDGDPIVVYDPLADRWILSQFAWKDPNSYHECIAVSKTSNPTGAYWAYDFRISTSLFNDYPKIGVWGDGYYVTFNDFGSDGFAGVTVAAFPRAKMIAGQAVTPVARKTSANEYSMLPADLDGRLPPPSGAPEILAEEDPVAGQLKLFSFKVDFAAKTSSITPLATLSVAVFDDFICDASSECIRQKGTSQGLDELSDRLMQRLAYRNYGASGETLVVNHTVDVTGAGRAGVRWYELRRTSGPWSIFQQGTYSPSSLSRWMGSAAMDGVRDIAVGYSASSTAAYPSIRYAGRIPSDPLGTLEAETVMRAGGGAQTVAERWGDYTSMSIDPADDCTFWYLGEYYSSTGGDWQTRVGSFRFPSCFGVSGALPATGVPSTLVTVTGVGFKSGAKVQFGGVAAPTTFVNATTLAARVPAAGKTGRLSVVQAGNTVISPKTFVVK